MPSIYNIISEDEAKKKWCRHGVMAAKTGMVNSDRTACNRGADDQPICFCLGSICMAWETVEVDTTAGKETKIGYCTANGRIIG